MRSKTNVLPHFLQEIGQNRRLEEAHRRPFTERRLKVGVPMKGRDLLTY